jgi:hypothetical protein
MLIVIAAVVFTVRNLIFTGLVERSWRDPMPSHDEEGYQEALETRHKQERTRLRSALAVIALYAAAAVLCGILKGFWSPGAEVIRIGGMLAPTVLMLVVALRSMVHNDRSFNFRLEQSFPRREKRDLDPGNRRRGV